jgi:hypothetical protein
MATENFTTAAAAVPPLSNIPNDRIEAALVASYELEALAINFPIFLCGEDFNLSDEYHQKLFVRRILELSKVVMSALDDDRETGELRSIVGLKEVAYGE